MLQELLPHIEIEPDTQAKASVILLHGGGGSGHEFAALAPKLSNGQPIRFIFPHADPIALTLFDNHMMRAWYDVQHQDLERDQDEDRIRAAEQALLGFIQREKERGIDSSRILIGGFSQGAAIALHTGLRYPEALAGILVLSAYLPLAKTIPEEATPASKKTPIFVAHGSGDELVPINLAKKGVSFLKGLGYQIDWHAFPTRHAVSNEEMLVIKKWIGKILD